MLKKIDKSQINSNVSTNFGIKKTISQIISHIEEFENSLELELKNLSIDLNNPNVVGKESMLNNSKAIKELKKRVKELEDA